MVVVDFDSHVLQALAVGFCAGLAVEVGDYHAVDAEVSLHELVPKAKHVHIVGNAQIRADFILFYIYGRYDDDNLKVFLELHKHLQLGIRLKSREDAAGVVVVEQFAAKLHIQFVPKALDALLDVFTLNFEIFLVVEPVFHR